MDRKNSIHRHVGRFSVSTMKDRIGCQHAQLEYNPLPAIQPAINSATNRDTINLITYFNDNPQKTEEIQSYFDLQVLNSLRCGWRPEQIKIRSNVGFSKHGVTAIPIKAKGKKTFAKWIGIRDTLAESKCTIWNHDHDGWQLLPFNDIVFDKNLWMFQWASLKRYPLFCSASFFISKNSLPLIEKLINYEKYENNIANEKTDEYLLTRFFMKHPNDMQNVKRELSLTYCYNYPFSKNDLIRVGDIPLKYVHSKFNTHIRLKNSKLTIPNEFKKLMSGRIWCD